MKKEIIPVLHIVSVEQAIKNLELLKKVGLSKVFIIAHENAFSNADNLLDIASLAKNKGFWVGCNFLGYDPIEILTNYGDENSFDALWYDNSFAGIENYRTEEIYLVNAGRKELFGGVAFKYCPQPKNLKEACEIASKYMDVVVTSGIGTGIAADVDKIDLMVEYLGNEKSLGIASGITPENINHYKAKVLLVSTGISSDFYNFDEQKIKSLMEAVK